MAGRSRSTAKKKKATKKPVAKKPATKKPSAKKLPTKKSPAKKRITKKSPARRAVVTAKALEHVTLSTEVPALPAEVLAAWLDSAAHTALTGAEASIDPRVGGRHSAWSGYIEGTLSVITHDRLVMSWRTSEFAPTDPDSQLEVRVAASPVGALLTIEHTGLPVGGAAKYGAGWRDHYFAPMARYFSRPR